MRSPPSPLFVCLFVVVVVVVFFFCWQLLICENTLIQVFKLKKKGGEGKNFLYPRWEPNPACRRQKPEISALGYERLFSMWKLILILISFFVTSWLSTWKSWCSERRKNHGFGQKKPKSTSSTIFGVETVGKSCELKRCADRVRTEPTRQIWTFRLNFIACFFSPKLNFSPSTKKTTEYSFELFFH